METNNKTQQTFKDLTRFPFTVDTQWAYIDGEWVKFHIVFNADGEPIDETPRTKEDLLRITRDFLSLLETL